MLINRVCMAEIMIESWQCPYCQYFATIYDDNASEDRGKISHYTDADVYFIFQSVTCPNNKCRKLSAEISFEDRTREPNSPAPTVFIPNQQMPSHAATCRVSSGLEKKSNGFSLAITT